MFMCARCGTRVSAACVHLAPQYVDVDRRAPLCEACWHALVESWDDARVKLLDRAADTAEE
jgi:hypothetical protein